MKINLVNAIAFFHPNTSFEQIYFEAIANAVDANSDSISININIGAFDKPETLTVTITDNGNGFTDKNFSKFARLLETDCAEHKGLGRLAYLAYFNKIDIDSHFDVTKRRRFTFDSAFNGSSKVTDVESCPPGSALTFSRFSGERIKSYDYLVPRQIKESIISHFLPLLFKRKEAKQPLTITISLVTDTPNKERDFFNSECTLTLADIPAFKEEYFDIPALDLFEDFVAHYCITNDRERPKSMASAICVDGRNIPYDLVPEDSVPGAHQIVFFFTSEFFIGKVDSSRQRLQLPDNVSERQLKHALRHKVAEIIEKEIPAVKIQNTRMLEDLHNKYPHLSGYFPQDTAGLIVHNETVESAQRLYFNDQREILECKELDDRMFDKALAVSSRVLMEYILYRARIIIKLKGIDFNSSEADIHNIIAPKRKSYRGADYLQDIYSNNVWLLDDKYISYATVLSEAQTKDVIQEIAKEDSSDESRPDITLIFSADPNSAAKVDVVVVELKKKGTPLAKSEEVTSQLRQRARRLLKYFPAKINRLWFYGVTDIEAEFRTSLLEDDYIELFSCGTVFYKSQPIIVGSESDKFPVDIFVMTYDALIKDAECRNSAFLDLLKHSIKEMARGHESHAADS